MCGSRSSSLAIVGGGLHHFAHTIGTTGSGGGIRAGFALAATLLACSRGAATCGCLAASAGCLLSRRQSVVIIVVTVVVGLRELQLRAGQIGNEETGQTRQQRFLVHCGSSSRAIIAIVIVVPFGRRWQLLAGSTH